MKPNTTLRILGIFLRTIHVTVKYLLDIYYGNKRKVVTPVENPLLFKSATQLAHEIREGKLKSESVVQAYVDRIQEVDPYINATVDRRFEDALQEARDVDLLVESGKYTKEQLAHEKPLLGVPLSVKIIFKVKGLRCSGGLRLYENVVATEDAASVVLMKNAGAIVITTTNMPELGMSLETMNFLYGVTCNPYDVNRTSGGSSGGESALISAGGSVLGLGNDAGGSLRIPAHFTGIFSHKPTRGLVPNGGVFPLLHPDILFLTSSGPLCRYAEDLIISMKVLSSQDEAPVKFDKKVDLKHLKVFYLTEIVSPCIQPVDNEILVGLKNAAFYFEKHHGAKVVEVKMPYLADVIRCVLTNTMPRLKGIKCLLTGNKDFNEKLDFLKFLFGKSFLSLGPLVILNFFCNPLFYRKNHISYYKEMMETWSSKLDNLLDKDSVLLMPTFTVTAPYYFEIITSCTSICYTALFNILGFPVTQCPIGFNKQGMPYGIQIAAAKNNDALAISCAIELEKAFGGWKPPGLS